MSIGTRIKQAREQMGLSRNEFAKIIGVTPSAVSNYENGISSPKEPVMFSILSALKCDANYLFQDDIDIKNIGIYINIKNGLARQQIKAFLCVRLIRLRSAEIIRAV